VLIVAAGVMLTVFLHAWINGAVSGLIQSTAHYQTGHVRVMTKAFAAHVDQNPNDLALLGIDTLFLLACRMLTLAEAQRRVSERIGIRGRAIVSPFAELGMDIDTPHQYDMVRNAIERRSLIQPS